MERDGRVLSAQVVAFVRVLARDPNVERRLTALEPGARKVLARFRALVSGSVRVAAVGSALAATLERKEKSERPAAERWHGTNIPLGVSGGGGNELKFASVP